MHVRFMKMSAFLKSITSALILKKALPFSVWHAPTFRCNLRCRYCGLWKRKVREMETEEIKEMMRFFRSKGTVVWNFTGGEPLLREDIGELIDYAKRLGFHTTLVTNGTLLKENTDKLMRLDTLILSLDGRRETNDFLRGEGTYEKVVEGMRMLKEKGIRFDVDFVLSKWNSREEEVTHVLELAKEFGARVNFLPVYTGHNVEEDESYRKVLPLIFGKYGRFVKTTRRFFERAGIKGKCFAGRNFLFIFPDGGVSPCLFREDLKVGHYERYEELQNPRGCSCVGLCYNTYNLLFSLDLKFVSELLLKWFRSGPIL